jgi:hypothetical protein
MTTGPSLAGFGTTAPAANLHVIGNVFASNSLSTPNIFASNILNVGTGTIGSNIALFSNIAGGQNAVVINANAWVGISNLAPATTLSVGGTISALGNATTFGTLAPVTWRQGSNSTTWSNTAGTATNFYLGVSQTQMQCGANATAIASLTVTITFPSPYINTPIIMATAYGNPTTLFVSNPGPTNFQVTTGVATSFEWISIGI